MAGLKPEEKAAALMVAVGSEAASNVLQFLSEDEVERLATEVARMGRLRPETVAALLEEVQEETTSRANLAAGGLDYARELLTQWKGSRGAEIIDRLTANLQVTPFNFIRDIDPEQIVHVLKDEHPQTVALILAHQPAAYAATVLQGFEADMRADVALRVARMGRTSPAVIARVEEALRGRLGSVSSSEMSVRGGVEDLAAVLNHSDRSTERAILDRLSRIDADIAEEVRALMFVFEDLVQLTDQAIQRVLQDVDTKDLAYAMKGIPEEVREAILRNMSQRASESLLEEMELLGAVRRQDVERAQTAIVGVIRRLEEAGEIMLMRAGEGELIE